MEIEKIREQIILNNPKMFPERARRRRKRRAIKMLCMICVMCILLFIAFILFTLFSPDTKHTVKSIIGYAEGSAQALAEKPKSEEANVEEIVNESEFVMPTIGRISSGFGGREDPFTGEEDFHTGIDIAANEGTVIYAAASGTVERAGTQRLAGNYVVIDHDNGAVTKYFHCSELLVSAGDRVDTSTPIALVGSTGNSTGPHLHFEVYIDNEAVNPLDLVK